MQVRSNKKGQIVIPSTLRKKYGIKAGTKIVFLDKGDSIVLKPITDQYLKSLQGSLRGKGALKVLLDERNNQSE